MEAGFNFCRELTPSQQFNESKINIKEITTNFDDLENYQDALRDAKSQYNIDSKTICVLRKPTSDWIRRANELLQANFDHKRIWFGSRPLDKNYHLQIKKTYQ